MVDVKNLKRIKGILSAKRGAEIPKYTPEGAFNINDPDFKQWCAHFSISPNPNTWAQYQHAKKSVSDGSLDQTIAFTQTNGANLPIESSTTAIPGDPQNTPTTAVESAARVEEKAQLAQEGIDVKKRSEGIQITKGSQNISTLNQPPTLNTSVNKDLYNTTAGMNVDGQLSAQDKVTMLNVGNAVGQGSAALINGVGQAFASKQQATDSDLTKTTDTVYSGVAETAKSFGPIGQAVGSIMGIAKGAGDIIQELGGGTDQQTKMDKWMDSAFFSWNIGMLNGFAGKNTQDFGVDQNIIAQVGSSYGGTVDTVTDAAEKAGKKYGLFSTKARKKADAAINKARSQQNLMGTIADNASDQRLAVQSMGEQAGLAYSLMTDGGYNQKYTYAAKQGGILEWEPDIRLEWEPQVLLNWDLHIFKKGGNIDINEELEWIPELQSGNKIRTIEELIEYAKQKNPRFIQRLSEEPKGIKFTDDKGNEAEGSHYLESRGEYVIPRIQEVDGELKLLNPQEAVDRAIESGNYLKMTPEEAILFAEKYKQGWPDFFEKFKKGGSLGNFDIPETEETNQKNVIPEGALHKNKHHMEHAEGLTKKGIPVIDEDGEQQAEIEHSEIIFTLEVTKKLEEYYKIFYSDESSNKEKEQAALDAGKLLVYQILENTEDRTGLIESCKKGGSLTLKKSTDDLIEEVLEWMPTVVIIEEEVKETPKKKEEKSDKEIMKEAIKEVLVELLTK